MRTVVRRVAQASLGRRHLSTTRRLLQDDKSTATRLSPSDEAGSLPDEGAAAGVLDLESVGQDGGWMLVKAMEAVLETAHAGQLGAIPAMPWWGTIAGATVVWRTLLVLPAAVYQKRAAARAKGLEKVTAAWGQSFASSIKLEARAQGKQLGEKEFAKKLKARMNKKHRQLTLQQGCHPAFGVALPLLQMPIWMSMTLSLRHLCGRTSFWFDSSTRAIAPALGMDVEGLLWFTNLVSVDSTMALPLVVCALNMANVVISRMQIKDGSLFKIHKQKSWLQRFATLAAHGAPIFQGVVALNAPAAIAFYWTLTASYGLVQNLVFSNQRVCKLLKFPDPRPTK
ncbi:hypothetical protein GGF46_001952 [Coemansia sp. RSA 552]|nr:hypothetical protein GGF46_001952 [Coemansia sp. RSA 552]